MAERDALDPEQNSTPRIKVTDRRKFDASGNRRPKTDEEVAEDAASPAAEPETIGEPDTDASGDAGRPSSSSGQSEPTAEAPRRGPAGSPPSGPTVEAGPSGTPGPGAAAAPDAGAGPGPEAPGEHPSPDDLPRDFAAFVEGQYFEALLYLGAMRHPQTGEVVEDLQMAKYKIDILSMLQDKTEGNLDAEESKLIEDVVYQLRMAYLQKEKVAKL